MSPNAARTRNALYVARHRARRRAGKIVLPIWAVDERVTSVLECDGLLDPCCDDPQKILQAIEKHFELCYLAEQRDHNDYRPTAA